ncbi:hypothetical protein ACH5RR_008533 [Cinchona calisaya]|uniref:Uncharacterized protein n=1 Tax=Cinchona calisaya TaxID=153742 RepID=A0ABD3AE46_9GENT
MNPYSISTTNFKTPRELAKVWISSRSEPSLVVAVQFDQCKEVEWKKDGQEKVLGSVCTFRDRWRYELDVPIKEEGNLLHVYYSLIKGSEVELLEMVQILVQRSARGLFPMPWSRSDVFLAQTGRVGL